MSESSPLIGLFSHTISGSGQLTEAILSPARNPRLHIATLPFAASIVIAVLWLCTPRLFSASRALPAHSCIGFTVSVYHSTVSASVLGIGAVYRAAPQPPLIPLIIIFGVLFLVDAESYPVPGSVEVKSAVICLALRSLLLAPPLIPANHLHVFPASAVHRPCRHFLLRLPASHLVAQPAVGARR